MIPLNQQWLVSLRRMASSASSASEPCVSELEEELRQKLIRVEELEADLKSKKIIEEVSPDRVRQNGEEFTVPLPGDAAKFPRKFRQLSNEQVFELAVHGKHGATRERLVREIMRVDKCTWVEARAKVAEMNKRNDQYIAIAQMPYFTGLIGAGIIGIASVPLVFHKSTVIWFAENIVKTNPEDIPVDEMTSIWAVGEYSWGTLEPILGTLSFILLIAQFMRANMQHLDYEPYQGRVNEMRARRLCRLYPQYDKSVVSEFARTDPWAR